MASCSYSSLLSKDSTACGASWKNPEDFQCVTIRDCNKDVSSHLRLCNVVDYRVESEFQLLLARAGTVKISSYYYPPLLRQYLIPFCF